jgi:DNA replication licensing factor MCM6
MAIKNLDSVQKIRDMKTLYVGKLTAISGTITRTTEVRPELVLGNFRCLVCNTENNNIV